MLEFHADIYVFESTPLCFPKEKEQKGEEVKLAFKCLQAIFFCVPAKKVWTFFMSSRRRVHSSIFATICITTVDRLVD